MCLAIRPEPVYRIFAQYRSPDHAIVQMATGDRPRIKRRNTIQLLHQTQQSLFCIDYGNMVQRFF